MDILGNTPIYQQLISTIKMQISNGNLKVGDPLPTETSICRKYSISRSTVRQAYSMLEQEGIITRIQGKGTFVSEPKLKRSLDNLYNFSSEMRMLGLVPSSCVLTFKKVTPPEDIAHILKITTSQPVYYIKRLRMANNEPLLLERAYIPTNFCQDLTEADLNDSLYAKIQEHTGATAAVANETYEAINLPDIDASILRCKPKDAALKISRTSTNSNGEIFEYCIITARGDKNVYQITLNKKNIEVSRSIT